MKYKTTIKVPEKTNYHEYVITVGDYCTKTFGPGKIKRKNSSRNKNNWVLDLDWVHYSIQGSFRRKNDALMFALRWN